MTRILKHIVFVAVIAVALLFFKYCDFPFDKGRMVGKT